MPFDRLCHTLIELVGIPSTAGHEEQVRAYIEQHVQRLGLSTQVDSIGNLIATLPGTGQPVLLNAHMDRVPPGLGHTPVIRDGKLYSDGKTNLGADDAAGIAIILELLTRIVEEQLPHPPLIVVFTVQEEAGLCGATSFDASQWLVSDGIVFDNAFEAGVVVSQGAAYEAFDIRITGRTGHPGKDLSQTIDAIEIFRATDYPHGSLADDQTRILFSRVTAGNARNAVPALLLIEGELRSFEAPEIRQRYLQDIRSAFEQTAQARGGKAEMTTNPHSSGYAIDENEPLLSLYRDVLARRGETLQLRPTFIGSDTSGFRPAVRTFTLSTGVVNEHSIEEYVPLAPLEQVVLDTLEVLRLWSQQ